jgi:hypothetical protein
LIHPSEPRRRIIITTAPSKPSIATDGSGMAVMAKDQLCRVLVAPAL